MEMMILIMMKMMILIKNATIDIENVVIIVLLVPIGYNFIYNHY
jgi:hypothetical protein